MERLKAMCNTRGYSLIEMTLVMGLLVLFSLATLTLVVSGSGAYKNLLASKESNSELRVTLAYVSNKVKQSDAAGCIRLMPQPYGEGEALVITEVIKGKSFETWIYFHEGILREGFVRSGTSVDDALCFDIARLSGFELSLIDAKKQLAITAWHESPKGMERAQTTVTLYAERY